MGGDCGPIEWGSLAPTLSEENQATEIPLIPFPHAFKRYTPIEYIWRRLP